jgi:hypothetical protein
MSRSTRAGARYPFEVRTSHGGRLLGLLLRATRRVARAVRRNIVKFHIRNAQAELAWLAEFMADDRVELLAAHGLQFSAQAIEAIEARQEQDRLQRDYLRLVLRGLQRDLAELDA